ncbi:MAG: rhomboid family intramembrane serine protease, partial [Hyphomonadaceae bacterium]|nr:rhomboid family intramembrane serine protease [Hyphomonadaceae bacterium]
QPIFNAPLIVVIMCILLVALYAAYAFAPFAEQQAALYDFALAPERFWAPAGSPKVYPDVLSGLMTLGSTALLHGDWMHVIINSLMLLAFGTPVARTFGKGPSAWGLWMIVFLGSVIAGSALYLALATAETPWAVGASGGTSGLIAAALLLDPYGMKRKLWAPEFLRFTFAFALANVLLTIAAPYALGMGIAWEAHLGGYIAGAVLMAVLPVKGYRLVQS